MLGSVGGGTFSSLRWISGEILKAPLGFKLGKGGCSHLLAWLAWVGVEAGRCIGRDEDALERTRALALEEVGGEEGDVPVARGGNTGVLAMPRQVEATTGISGGTAARGSMLRRLYFQYTASCVASPRESTGCQVDAEYSSPGLACAVTSIAHRTRPQPHIPGVSGGYTAMFSQASLIQSCLSC